MLTIHGLLHLVDDIRTCGPIWTTWSFFMERFCGVLKSGLQSRSQPWANLNKRVLHMAYLTQLAARYDLEDELTDLRVRKSHTLSQSEKEIPGCEYFSY